MAIDVSSSGHRTAAERRGPFTIVLFGAAIVMALAAASTLLNEYQNHMMILALLFSVLGMSHRLLFLCGFASMGHGAFFAIGAYVVAALTSAYGLSPWLALIPAAALSAIAGLVIGLPALRTRGPYFLIVTFGFAVVTHAVIVNWRSVTGGNSGIGGIPPLPGITSVQAYLFLSLALATVVCLVFYFMERSRWNLELRAIGASADLAQSVGIAPTANALCALVLGAGIAGLVGGVFATYSTFLAPSGFTTWVSVYIFAYSIIGGAQFLAGPIFGAVYVTLIPVALSWSQSHVALFVSGSLALIMLIAPDGVVTAAAKFFSRFNAKRTEASGAATLAVVAVPIAPPLERPPAEKALEVRSIVHHFGGLQTAKDISFEVAEGEIVGVIGPNGAGKTTLFNLISGFLTPEKGEIVLAGRRINGLAPYAIERLGLTRSFQASLVFEKLTVFENVLLGIWGSPHGGAQGILSRAFRPRLNGEADRRRAMSVIGLFGLTALVDQPAANLSYGLKKTLGLAVVFATAPRVLCLDEPVAGMTDAEVGNMLETLKRVRAETGLTLLIVEHRMALIMGLCDKIVVLNFGEVVTVDTPEQIVRDPAVHQVYFGH